MNLFATKFQIFNNETIAHLPEETIKKIQENILSYEQAQELFNYGKKIGQTVFFTPMYIEAIDWLKALRVDYYKIRYNDNKNLPLYRKMKETNKPIFISCQNPRDTIYYNMAKYQSRIHFLFCISQYPAQYNDYVNYYIPNYFYGISDHTSDTRLLKYFINESIYFEKHIKLKEDKNLIENRWSVTFEQLEEVLKKNEGK